MSHVFWSVVALDAALFAVLLAMTLAQRGPADGGREMALFFYIALPASVLLAAVGLFVWCDSSVVRGFALFVVAVPGLFIAGGQLRGLVIDHRIAQDRSGAGYFNDAAMRVLGAAVVQRDVKTLKRIGPSVDVNTVGERGMTLLALAAERYFGDVPVPADGPEFEVVRTLLALGAQPDQALDSASKLKQTDLLRVLLDAGGNANLRTPGDQPLAFRWLSILPPDNLRLLATHGLDLNTTSYGDPFAVSATIYRRWDLLAVLIELGADTTRPRPDGRTVVGELTAQLAEEAKAGRAPPPDLLRAKALLDARPSTP